MMGESEVGIKNDAENSGSLVKWDNIILNENLRLIVGLVGVRGEEGCRGFGGGYEKFLCCGPELQFRQLEVDGGLSCPDVWG